MSCCLKLSEVLKAYAWNFLIIDIRNQQQFSDRHLPSSLNIPFSWLAENITTLPYAEHILLIGDYKNAKTEEAVKMFKQAGITHVSLLCGGVKAWSSEIEIS